MTDAIDQIKTFVVQIPRDTPYLGPLREGESVNRVGYVVRRGNRTIYPVADRSLLLRITTRDGVTGWGETYGILAPGAVRELIADVVAPILEGRDPSAPATIHDELYDLMRVRGYFGGFWLDALAAVDIALWDILGKRLGVPVSTLLGGQRHDTIPAYVSGLPAATLEERCDLARGWIGRGFAAVKFAAVVADDGAEAEITALRRALGDGPGIMADLHWKNTAPEAIRLIRRMEPHGLIFAEAPCAPEDVEGTALVARAVGVPVALGEELRTVHEWLPRFERRCMGIAQPEMGRTGITEFARIGALADVFHVAVAPHATIGAGVFLAASLQVASTLAHTTWHEYQHSVFDRGRGFVTGDMDCRAGDWTVPTGAGIGAEPTEDLLRHVVT